MSGMNASAVPGEQSDAEIVYGLASSSLGTVLVARKATGVCAILLGDSAERLKRDLGEIFRNYKFTRQDQALSSEISAAVDIAERPWAPFQPPLAIGGTEFQRIVWSAVSEVPPGSTVSYSEIARRIGAPASLRAVAGACAANILAIAIPCHRILRSNGTLSGYRWGLERKRKLIEREKRH